MIDVMETILEEEEEELEDIALDDDDDDDKFKRDEEHGRIVTYMNEMKEESSSTIDTITYDSTTGGNFLVLRQLFMCLAYFCLLGCLD